MKIFIAYGYNERDKWIKDLVFPLVQAFGSEIETGEETYDSTIPQIVKSKIERSDALIGFTTKREPLNPASTLTHRWVIEELAAAVALDKKFVEVREIGVDPQGGLGQHNQRIEYDEKARDKCLVNLVAALGVWHKSALAPVQLRLEGLTDDELLNLGDNGLCEYTIRTGSSEITPPAERIVGIKGGLFIFVPKNAEDSLIKLKLSYGSKKWSSDFDSLDSYKIELRLR
jgi:hypothetical protein